ncbi:MAG: glycosyltransferase family 39 protein [Bacteroidetes bacterium]|nr:glycosyltransferase family 39 protein [Bacteroidota bacterium]
MNKEKITNWEFFLLALAVLVNLSGLFVTILGPDGALYASIAKTMALSNDYVNLIALGRDWLDKPHFPFWVTAFSFKLFGIHTWSYKLPAILFLFAGAYYTYLFARSEYNKRTGIWAAIILLTAEHIIISNNDVRAEPYLTGLIIASVYHFYKVIKTGNFWQLVWASLFTAAAVMTKGIFVLIPVGGAIAGGLMVQKQWKQLFHLRWVMGGLLILVFITPELYCLWSQFDQHPEKIVFGKTGVSGLKFFFWDSQFGRFTNTGPIKGSGDYFFFVHTDLWAFSPWSLILYTAIVTRIAQLVKGKAASREYFALSGGVLTFLLFSLSKFQLPHYTNIIFPFFAIVTAGYIFDLIGSKPGKVFLIIQVVSGLLFFVISTALQYFFFDDGWIYWIIYFIPALLVALWVLGKKENEVAGKIVFISAISAIIVNFYLNTRFYPALLRYQSGSEAAFYLNANYKDTPVSQYIYPYPYDLQFYISAPMKDIDKAIFEAEAFRPDQLIYIAKDDAEKIKQPYKLIKSFKGYPVSRLKGSFINKETRKQQLRDIYLIQVLTTGTNQ